METDAPAPTAARAHVDFTQELRRDVRVTRGRVLLAAAPPTGAAVTSIPHRSRQSQGCSNGDGGWAALPVPPGTAWPLSHSPHTGDSGEEAGVATHAGPVQNSPLPASCQTHRPRTSEAARHTQVLPLWL